MQINGQQLTPELFIELINSPCWKVTANEFLYIAKRQEGGQELTIWSYIGNIYSYLEAYWPRRINTIQYQALCITNWTYQLNTSGDFVEVRKKGQEAVCFWLPRQDLTRWGQTNSTNIGETYPLH